jgi:CRISPR-associated protein Cas1
MRRLGNTLYVTTQGSHLSKQAEAVRVGRDNAAPVTVPIHGLDGIVVFGGATITPPLLGHCLERGIIVTWLSESGRFLGRAEGPVSGNILLRRAQYRASDDREHTSAIARTITIAKVSNQRQVLRRYLRDYPGDKNTDTVMHAADALGRTLAGLEADGDVDWVRGHEGSASASYFAAFGALVRVGGITFPGRVRRPPTDLVNALLSFSYVLLTHDVRGALETVGLDPAAGFLHRDRPGRPSLALDMVEEFRAPIADRLVLSLLNRQQVGPDDATVQPSGAVLLSDTARKTLINAYQERKREAIIHPFTTEKSQIGLLWFEQARLLAAHLRGDLDAYPPLIIR